MRTTLYEAGALKRYGIAVLAAVVAFAASYATWPYSTIIPWLFFFAAIMVSAWFGGQRASVVTTAILVVVGRYFFMKPFGTFTYTTDTLLQTLIFVGVSLFIGFLASARRRAQAYERAERRRFQATVMSIADAVIATDAAGRVAFLNGVAERLTGWSTTEAETRPLDEVFVVVTDQDGKIAALDRELAPVETSGGMRQMVIIARDGSMRPIEANAAPIKDDRGEATGVVLVFRDIQQRTAAEKARQDLTAQLAAHARIFDTALSNAADFVYTFDLQGRFTYLNHSLLTLLRKEADQAVGKNFFELGYPSGLAERLQKQIQEVIDSRGRVSDETPFTSALGTRYYEYIFVPVIGPDGEVEAVAGSTRDITERRQVEEATRRRAGQLQKLAEIATRMSAARDVNSVVGVVTQEAVGLIGARRAATTVVLSPLYPQRISMIAGIQDPFAEPDPTVLDGRAFYDTVNAEAQAVRLTQDDLAHDRRWWLLEKVALAIPRSSGWLAVPLAGRDGKNMGLLELADKTDGEFTAEDEAILVQLARLAAIAIENAKLYDELKNNDQRKDEFLAMLAHELRNPLAAIGNAVSVTMYNGTKEHVDWSMEIIQRQLTHLTRLIDDLLDVSRITRGKIELVKGVIDMTPILDGAIASVRPFLEERKQVLEASIERGRLWVDVDPTRFEQVVVNLLNNAAKFSENGGRIELVAKAEGANVVMIIRDQGVGIRPEQLPGIFELFVQGDRSLARSEGGLGIGLTVVKRLVEMHGGNITARSEGPGKGSEFTIRLPAAQPSGEAHAGVSAPTAKKIRPARILVVDDNVDMVRGLSMLLTLIGHEVATAHDGHAALETAREFRPEFILLDIGLPGMDGYEVVSRLRRDEYCKDAVIVAVTGYGRDEDRRRSKEAGFDYHLIKPLDHDALLSVLSSVGAAT